MQYSHISGHSVCYSAYKYAYTDKLKEFLESAELRNICSNLKQPTIVVIGGDGTMLRAIKENYKLQISFLGINLGNKGFLLNNRNFIKESSEYEKISYPLMQCDILIGDKKSSDIFINEVNIAAGAGKMIELEIGLCDTNHINIIGDGIIVTTPTGSTGYNYSLGGPILPHNIPVLAITPKAPWKPRNQHPIILPDDKLITIKNVGRKSILEVYCDGREVTHFEEEDIEILIKKSEYTLELLIEKCYKQVWDNKVFQELGFERKK